MTTKKPAARRTQSERRATTVATLINATIETMRAVGYSRTTVNEICTRARLSHGALFRCFPTLLDLIVAAAEEIGQRQLRDFERKFVARKDAANPLVAALVLLRSSCRSQTNAVFYELLVAARTDTKLRAAMKAGTERFFSAIREVARKSGLLAALPPDVADTLMFTAIHLFDGETLLRQVYRQPQMEERRMQLLELVIATTLPPPNA